MGISAIPDDVDIFAFRPGSPRHHYAVVKDFNTWDVIAEGYRLAAEKLANSVIASGNYQDELVYPICFLYRCYLEIRLKGLLVAAQPGIDVIKYRHDLLKLWKDAVPLVRRFSGGPAENISRIERYLRQFQKIDPAGDGFRYPCSVSRSLNLANLTQIDLGTLRRVIESISVELDGASTGIWESKHYIKVDSLNMECR